MAGIDGKYPTVDAFFLRRRDDGEPARALARAVQPLRAMHLDLSNEDGLLLKTELARRIDELDRELVRTDKHELQVALDQDIQHLRVIYERLSRTISTASGASAMR